MLDENQVTKALKTVLHPKLRKSLVDIGMIRNIRINGDEVGLTLALKSDHGPLKDKLVRDIEHILRAIPGVTKVAFDFATLSQEEGDRLFPKVPLEGIEKIGRFIAVASGKGGVGKTTIAVNLSMALSRMGYRTGLLDADIYGPSVPLMLGLPDSLREEGGMILPCEKYGLHVVSLGMTAGETDAFIWRGPLVSKMIRHLLGRVKWGELDFLVLDLPPGTGDPSITIAQSIPQAQILMVTTPQEISLADVRRSITLFQRHNLQVAGLIENMSYFRCGHSADPIQIFGSGGGEKLSRETGLPLLGAIPFDIELGRSSDSGVPLMLSAPDSEAGLVFQQVAREMSKQAPEIMQKAS